MFILVFALKAPAQRGKAGRHCSHTVWWKISQQQEHGLSCLEGLCPEPPLTSHLNTQKGLQDWLLRIQSIQKRKEADAKERLSCPVLHELMSVAFAARSIHTAFPFQVPKSHTGHIALGCSHARAPWKLFVSKESPSCPNIIVLGFSKCIS